jgi:outer membrane translocation and assembly module TamA
MRTALLTAVIFAVPVLVSAQCWTPPAAKSPHVATLDATVEPHEDVAVRSFRLIAVPVLTPDEQKEIEHGIAARSYVRDGLREISERVRMAYQDYGYFKASVGEPEVRVVEQDKQHEIVDVSVAVDPGRQYRLKEILLTGGKAFSAAELRQALTIHPGDIFDTGKVRGSLEQLRRLYGSKGYLNFTPVPDTKLDDNTGQISLQIDLDEGRLFRAGALVVEGQEAVPGARDKLLETWKRYQGIPYDSQTLLSRFLQDLNACPGVHPEEIFTWSHDERTGLVKVEITLAESPR